jgi:hypothetical protein
MNRWKSSNSKTTSEPRIIGFDTETIQIPYRGGEKETFFSFQAFPPPVFLTSPREVQKFILSLPPKTKLVGWRIDFDLEVLRSILPDEISVGYKISKSKIISGWIGNHKVVELSNLIPLRSLSEVGRVLGVPKLNRPQYLGKRKPKPEEMNYFKRYAIRDAEICFRGYQRLLSLFPSVPNTLPSLSSFTFRRFFRGGALYPRLPSEVEEMGDAAYRGGRTECFVRGSPDRVVYYYDVNSLYPYVMSAFKYPLFSSYVGEKTNVDLDKFGIADALIYQDADIPLIGVKRKVFDRYQKLVFPEGKVRGVFTYPELQHLEEWDVGKILKVYKAYEWREGWYPFREFVETFYQERNKGEFEKAFYKLFLNSLYGKFAEKNPIEKVELFRDGSVKRETLDGKRLRNPIIASYITSYGRIYLYSFYRKVGFENVLYSDTDSIHSYRKLPEAKGILGGLKREAIANLNGEREVVYVRSKCYVFRELVRWKGWGGAIKREDIIEGIRRGNLGNVETLLTHYIFANRLGLSPLFHLKRYKVFSLLPDGKRKYLRDLEGKELLEDFTPSLPIKLKDPERDIGVEG